AKVISARCAHLSQPKQIHLDQGRVQCQNRTLCQRGCPFGGYFSSNASTLPWAAKTGNMTLRPDSVVHSILYDENKQKAIGVKVIDNKTKDEINFYADIIFVNAGAIATNLLLLNSISSRFPNGLGNDSDTLGKYVAFHNYSARIYAEYEGFQEYRTDGRNPAGGAYIPRFRNLHKQEMDYLRGYAAGFGANRMRSSDQSSYGIDLKESLLEPKWGAWGVSSHMMGE